MNSKVSAEQHKLDHLFNQVSKVDDVYLKSHLSNHLCILVSGYIENSMKHLLGDYSAAVSHSNVKNFIDSKLKNITNLNTEKITQLLVLFSKDWGLEFKDKIGDDQKDAFDAIIANRSNIVHGRTTGNVTYVRVKEYYEKIKSTLIIINNIIK